MKQHHSIFPPAASLACALILMLAACTSDALDELPPAGTDPDARPLTITVSDGGMYATGQTRAQERGAPNHIRFHALCRAEEIEQ